MDCPAARDFDYWDHSAMTDPFPLYAELRDTCPVARSDKHGGFWIASQYEDIRTVTSDYRTYISGQGVSVPDFPSPYRLFPVESDKPMHDQYHRILYKWFQPAEMKKLEPTARLLTNELIDDFIEKGSGQLNAEMAAPLVAKTIGPFLGLGRSEWPRLSQAAYEMLYVPGMQEQATAAFFEFMTEQFALRQRTPGNDLLTELLHAEIEDDGVRRTLTEFERMSIAWASVQASIDTTAGFTITALWYLGQHPELRRKFVDDLDLVAANVEEFARMFTAVTVSRTVTADTVLHDTALPAGDKVVILLGSANRDPRVFDDPDEFVIGRSPNRHLGFGQGIHKCLGIHMAKMEFTVMIQEVLRRMPDYQVGDGPPTTSAGATWRVLDLPVTFTPGRREVAVGA